MNSQIKKITSLLTLSITMFFFQNCESTAMRFVDATDVGTVVKLDAGDVIEVEQTGAADNLMENSGTDEGQTSNDQEIDGSGDEDDVEMVAENPAGESSESGESEELPDEPGADSAMDTETSNEQPSEQEVAVESKEEQKEEEFVSESEENVSEESAVEVPVIGQQSDEVPLNNLLINGDFEMEDGRVGDHRGAVLNNMSNKAWDVFSSLPGLDGHDSWVSTFGPGIELQKSSVVKAQSGNNYVELDSHSGHTTNSNMVQVVSIPADGSYLLSFFYYRRTSSKNDNNIIVSVNGSDVLEVKNTKKREWLEYKILIEGAQVGEMEIAFRAAGKDNAHGGFIDNASLVSASQIVLVD